MINSWFAILFCIISINNCQSVIFETIDKLNIAITAEPKIYRMVEFVADSDKIASFANATIFQHSDGRYFGITNAHVFADNPQAKDFYCYHPDLHIKTLARENLLPIIRFKMHPKFDSKNLAATYQNDIAVFSIELPQNLPALKFSSRTTNYQENLTVDVQFASYGPAFDKKLTALYMDGQYHQTKLQITFKNNMFYCQNKTKEFFLWLRSSAQKLYYIFGDLPHQCQLTTIARDGGGLIMDNQGEPLAMHTGAREKHTKFPSFLLPLGKWQSFDQHTEANQQQLMKKIDLVRTGDIYSVANDETGEKISRFTLNDDCGDSTKTSYFIPLELHQQFISNFLAEQKK